MIRIASCHSTSRLTNNLASIKRRSRAHLTRPVPKDLANMITAERIKDLIEIVDRVSLVDGFAVNGHGVLCGRIKVELGEDGEEISWEVKISHSYPFKVMGIEPIRFINN